MLILGNFLAFLSVFLWSSLYVCVKILLEYFKPLELLVLQFIIGYCFLLLLKPKFLRLTLKEEFFCAVAGLCGITFYNLFLNLAIDYSYASNVSVIIATAPLFTGIFAFVFKIEKVSPRFFVAFFICMFGIILLSFQENGFSFNPLGDAFAFLSALSWGIYALLIVKILQKKNTLLYTRRMIFYGILFMIPSFFFLDFAPNLSFLKEPKIALLLVFLSIFASGICFILWNYATFLIGAVQTNIYVYCTPVITILISWSILGESLHPLALFGVFCTLLGVILAERH